MGERIKADTNGENEQEGIYRQFRLLEFWNTVNFTDHTKEIQIAFTNPVFLPE